MPTQTTKTSNIRFPDGAKVSIQASGDVGFTDLGAISTAVNATLNWVENQVETANAGKTVKQIREMTIAGDFTLIELDPVGVDKLGGGLFEKVDTAGSPLATIPDQVIAAGWDGDTIYDLDMQTSSSDSTPVRTSAKPTVTVTLDLGGTPEVLTEANGKINIFQKADSKSGWAMTVQQEILTTGSPTTFAITLEYGSNTPIANTTLFMGTSTTTLSAYALRIQHTDDNALTRTLDLYSVDTNSGGFQFNFKGANEDGLEEMPLSYTAKVDSTRTDGRQLAAWSIDTGAA